MPCPSSLRNVSSGTPGTTNVGTPGIKVTATDPVGLSTSETFNIAVATASGNTALVLTAQTANQNATVGSAFSWRCPPTPSPMPIATPSPIRLRPLTARRFRHGSYGHRSWQPQRQQDIQCRGSGRLQLPEAMTPSSASAARPCPEGNASALQLRALMGNPRILIFDEATSAFDYESEHAIQANVAAIARLYVPSWVRQLAFRC